MADGRRPSPYHTSACSSLHAHEWPGPEHDARQIEVLEARFWRLAYRGASSQPGCRPNRGREKRGSRTVSRVTDCAWSQPSKSASCRRLSGRLVVTGAGIQSAPPAVGVQSGNFGAKRRSCLRFLLHPQFIETFPASVGRIAVSVSWTTNRRSSSGAMGLWHVALLFAERLHIELYHGMIYASWYGAEPMTVSRSPTSWNPSYRQFQQQEFR